MLLSLAAASGATHADLDAGLVAFRAGDHGLALSEFMPLAQQGDAEAQFHLGIAYQKGWGVIADPAKALQWYRRAADQGHA
ncbi:MAG: SEL1-like repeat protein, partial [Gammaproteobacteria bacterium]|nr:SEL1-like repeat protein [Gammaproteobacteria bacterium]